LGGELPIHEQIDSSLNIDYTDGERQNHGGSCQADAGCWHKRWAGKQRFLENVLGFRSLALFVLDFSAWISLLIGHFARFFAYLIILMTFITVDVIISLVTNVCIAYSVKGVGRE